MLQYCYCFFFFFWSQGTWDLSSCSCTLCIGRQSLNHWATRKVPWHSLNSIASTLFWVAMRYGRGDYETPEQSHDWPKAEPIKSLGCHYPCQWLVWNEHVVRVNTTQWHHSHCGHLLTDDSVGAWRLWLNHKEAISPRPFCDDNHMFCVFQFNSH